MPWVGIWKLSHLRLATMHAPMSELLVLWSDLL